MKKSNLFTSKNIILIIVIILFLSCMYKLTYFYKLNNNYSRYFTKQINSKIREMKNDMDNNAKVLNDVIENKYIDKNEWDILFGGYKTLHSNISYLKDIINYTRLEPHKKYELETNHDSPYAKYYNYFLTSTIRFEFENKSTIYLNEKDIIYFTTMLDSTKKYLDILAKYDAIKIYVNDDDWIDLIEEINRISF